MKKLNILIILALLIGNQAIASYKACNRIKFFGRYDKLTSCDDMDMEWDLGKDGSLIIIGLPVKGVKISPNYQGWNPKDASKHYMTEIFMNMEIKF